MELKRIYLSLTPAEQIDVSAYETVYNKPVRSYYKNKSLPSLRKSIVMVENLKTKLKKNLLFVQYIFHDGEQRVVVKAHGNEKSATNSRPYKRTMKSTTDHATAKLNINSPRN
jgi:hypothetical protein